MGVIKDGTVSGVLPSNQGFAVHYPGYSSTISRSIDTLGGIQGILKARNSQSNKLELRFRPEDPYSHPAFGELRPCNNLLLKIFKKKSYDGHGAEASDSMSKCPTLVATRIGDEIQTTQPGSEDVEEQTLTHGEANLYADIVAHVPEAYCFDGMIDYQHVVAVHADVARRKKRNWSEVEELQFEKGGLMDVDQEDVMIIVPPLFSLKDVPENLVLRPHAPATLSSKKKHSRVENHYWENDKEQIPKIVNWEDYIPQGSDQWESQMAVSRLFDERPIWKKDSLAECLLDKGLKFKYEMLRRLLSRIAYYFSSGPFLRFWIRKGYDPRKDPDSRIYQRLDFRVPLPLRSYCDANAGNQMKHRWEDICAFRVFPSKLQTSLQLFELVDDYIQLEIRKPPTQTTCSFKD
ncbi:general transcription factor 3C polypeptide 5-like [Quillaja saponaria]|uniref:General transcription factor 3C polypeptide 5-like n=1 Tax=Quillaja saponaria TaxID=32244 RepID=A0AAD7M352_QUISA|nr:general transcription factor 3C polypeptide 5-like [Quillaja saponaria]